MTHFHVLSSLVDERDGVHEARKMVPRLVTRDERNACMMAALHKAQTAIALGFLSPKTVKIRDCQAQKAQAERSMRSSSLRALPVVAVVAASSLWAALSGAPAYAEDVVKVVTDRAKVFRIDEPADTIIIGNPAIADATMHDRTTLVITGKAYGTTNLVILNKAGNPIIDEVIAVEPPAGSVITLMRASETYSYDCSPACKPHLNIGDQKDYFETTQKQITARRSLSEGGADGQAGQ